MTTLTVEALLAGAGLTHRVAVPEHLAAGPGDGSGEGNAAGGGGEVVLRPLVLADLARLAKASGDDSDLAGALMVAQALVEPRLTVDQVHRLPAGLVDFLLAEVNRVSGLTTPADEIADAVHAPLARACFVLAREFGWTPQRCAELTIGQVLLYLEMLGRGERAA